MPLRVEVITNQGAAVVDGVIDADDLCGPNNGEAVAGVQCKL